MSLTVYADPVSDKVRELVSLLHMASSDVIFCAFSDSEDVNLIKKILLQLAKGIFFYELYNRGNTNLASEIASMTSEDSDFKVIEKYERRTGNSKIVISVFNLERFLDTESVDELNLYRDLFLRIGYPVLIWIPEKSISHLVEEAPDFWRIRTKVFYFQEAEVLNRKGKDLVDMQKCEEALEYFDKALENDPKNIDTLKNKGLTLYNLGKRQEAIACYNKALETDSTRADILLIRPNVFITLCPMMRLRNALIELRK